MRKNDTMMRIYNLDISVNKKMRQRSCKKISALIFGLAVIILSSQVYSQVSPWVTKSPTQMARTGAAAGVINGKLYVVSGSPDGGGTTNTVEEYDPVSDTWTYKTPIPTARMYAGAGVIANKLYVVGGCAGGGDCLTSTTAVLEVYDPATDAWETKNPMPTYRSSMAVCVLKDSLYVIGGMQECGPCNPLAIVEVYDPITNNWTAKTPMNTPRSHLGKAGVINGRIYVVGGQSGGVAISSMEIYSPTTNNWSYGTPMPTARFSVGCAVSLGKLFVISGNDGSSPVDVVESYNPLTDTWKTLPPIPTMRYGPSVGVIDGVIYVAGSGSANNPIDVVEAFAPIDLGLVAWYPFMGGSLMDSTGNGNDGANYNAILTFDRFGNVNCAYDFNGQDAYINCGNGTSLDITGNITLSAWIKPDSLLAGRIFSKRNSMDGYELDVFNGTDVRFVLNGSNSGSVDLSGFMKKWVYVVATYDGTTARIYINGVLQSTYTVTLTIGTNSNELLIGEMSNMSSNYFNGSIDDIRIFNRSINEIEIQQLYHQDGWDTNPRVASFTPESGPTGTIVTIDGANFNPNLDNNIVHFGAVKAFVYNASESTLDVMVPTGATYKPISVTNTATHLTGYSRKPFSVTFPSSRVVDISTFAPRSNFGAGTYPYDIKMADIDGDDQSDLIVANYNSFNISILQNTSTEGNVSFDPKIDYMTGSYPRSIAVADLNGDGNLDIIVVNNGADTVSILPNKSMIGNISFAAKLDYQTGVTPYSVAIGDLDGDGRPDLVVANAGGASLSIYRNTTLGNNISFAPRIDISVGSTVYDVAVKDFNGDKKADLVAVLPGTTIALYKSLCSYNHIEFGPRQNFTVGNNPNSVAIGDIDGDNNPDLATSNQGSNSVSVLLNTSTLADISFAPKADFATGASPYKVAIGDVDGDGIPDLAVANYSDATVSVLKNISTIGNVSLLPKIDYSTGVWPHSVAIGDIDIDGKPELAVANYANNNVSVLLNTVSLGLIGEYITDNDAVLLAHMNEPSGTIVEDASYFFNNGTASGTAIVPGRFGNARDIASAGNITFPHKTELNFGSGPFTMEAWFKTSLSTSAMILGKGMSAGYRLFWDTPGRLRAYIADASSNTVSAMATPNYADNKWRHVAVVRDAANLKLYVNGILVGQANAGSVGSTDNVDAFTVGANSFVGTVDEIRLSKIARNPLTFNVRLRPTDLTSFYSDPSIYLVWSDGGGAAPLDHYNIYRGTVDSAISELSLIDSTDYNIPGYSDANITSGTKYFYRVSPVDSTDFEGELSYATVVTAGSGGTPPAIPAGLNASAPTSSLVILGWFDVSNEQGYRIQRRVAGGSFSLWDSTLADIAYYSDTRVSSNTTYYYRVEAFNAYGSSGYCAEVPVTTPVGDTDPPAITDNTSVPLPIVRVNNSIATPSIDITASAIDPSGINSFTLLYVRIGDQDSTEIPFLSSIVRIPDTAFVRRGFANGVSYRLRAIDNQGNQGYTAWKSFVVRNETRVTAQNEQPMAGGLSSDQMWRAYRIVSIPYELDLNNRNPASFLPNCLGGGHWDKDVPYARWRFLRYINNQFEDYDGFQNQAVMTLGAGFFLIVKDGGYHLSAGPGTVADPNRMATSDGVNLNANWNLVGNPFGVNVPVDSLSYIRQGNSYPENIQQTAYFSGGPINGGWLTGNEPDARVLRPWGGLAIRVPAQGKLYFRVPGSRPPMSIQAVPKLMARIAPSLQQDAMNWTLPIDAERIDNNLQCKGSAVGMVGDAKAGDDCYDLYMPPFIGGSNLMVYFGNPNEEMLRDIRPLNDEGGVWGMHVITGDAGARVKLQFAEKLDLPNPEFEAYLIDLDQRMAHNLKKVSALEISSGDGTRNFRVVVGKKSFVEQNNAGVKLAPSEIKLYANYPNPFNPSTVIRYTIPDASPSYTVTLKIFNMLGQEINTLVNERQTAGYYEVRWDARGQSSGIYFYQMSITDGIKTFHDIKKMVLMK